MGNNVRGANVIIYKTDFPRKKFSQHPPLFVKVLILSLWWISSFCLLGLLQNVWKGFSFVKLAWDQMDWSFSLLILQSHLQLQCLHIHICHSVTKFYISLAYRSRKKDILWAIGRNFSPLFSPENNICDTLNTHYERLFGYNWNPLTSRGWRIKYNTISSWNDWRNPLQKVVCARGEGAIFDNFERFKPCHGDKFAPPSCRLPSWCETLQY